MLAYYAIVLQRAASDTGKAVGDHLRFAALVLGVGYVVGVLLGTQVDGKSVTGLLLIPLSVLGIVALLIFSHELVCAPVRLARERTTDLQAVEQERDELLQQAASERTRERVKSQLASILRAGKFVTKGVPGALIAEWSRAVELYVRGTLGALEAERLAPGAPSPEGTTVAYASFILGRLGTVADKADQLPLPTEGTEPDPWADHVRGVQDCSAALGDMLIDTQGLRDWFFDGTEPTQGEAEARMHIWHMQHDAAVRRLGPLQILNVYSGAGSYRPTYAGLATDFHNRAVWELDRVLTGRLPATADTLRDYASAAAGDDPASATDTSHSTSQASKARHVCAVALPTPAR